MMGVTMKKIVAAVATLLVASTATAGNLAVLEEPAPVAEEQAMGGSNAGWLVPLLLIAGVVALASSGNGNGGANGAGNGEKVVPVE